MVLFTTKNCKLTKNDDYYTPTSAWRAIAHLIPRGLTIWEPFYGDGSSGATLRDMGWDVIHQPNEDFFQSTMKGDIIVTNPPFSETARVLWHLKDLEVPFLIILPAWKLHASYMRDLFGTGEKLQIVIPRRRIHFLKMRDGCPVPLPKGHRGSSFECFYVAYKLNLQNDITWLD